MSRSRIDLILLLFAMVFPTLAAWVYFDAAAPASATPPASALVGALYFGSKVLQFLLPAVAWRLSQPERLRPTRPTWHGIRPALAVGVAAAIGIVAVYFIWLQGHELLAGVPAAVGQKVAALGIGTPLKYVLFSIFLAVIHSGLEEYYWRAYVFSGLKRRINAVAAIVISALAFTSHHLVVLSAYQPNRFWSGVLPLSAGVFVGGAVWAWLYHRFNTMYPSWISHAVIDVAIMVVGYDMAFGL